MTQALITLIRDIYGTDGPIPLHVPRFSGRENSYVADTIATTFVSSVGPFVDRFEAEMADLTGAGRAVAVVNGTAALHIALVEAGVGPGDIVLTQALTFVATANAISYTGAQPAFLDVERETLGMSPEALFDWLKSETSRDDQGRPRHADRIVRACMPMHTFGHPARIDQIAQICADHGISLIEDASEGIGSTLRGQHLGTFGQCGTISFNGNKLITTGGGGMVLTDEDRGLRIKHLTATAKRPHQFEYVHDAIGYNYRMPNLNAALGCAQLEQLPAFLSKKRALAETYAAELNGSDFDFVLEPAECRSNYWLNAVIAEDRGARDALLAETNAAGIGTRPIWRMMHNLPMYADCLRGDLSTSEWLEGRVVNLPSSVPVGGSV